VLQPFNAKEREVIGVAIQEAVDVLSMIMDEGTVHFFSIPHRFIFALLSDCSIL
jgi:hypothetical protein